MDYFDSSFKDDMSRNQVDLPEDFNWENMKDGIYEKMGKSNGPSPRKYWGLLLLLLISGCGGWLALDYFDGEKLDNKQVEQVAELVEKILNENESIQPVIDSKSIPNDSSLNSMVKQELTEETNPNKIIAKSQSDSQNNGVNLITKVNKDEKQSEKNEDLAINKASKSETNYTTKTVVDEEKKATEIGETKKENVLVKAEAELTEKMDLAAVKETISQEEVLGEYKNEEAPIAIIEEEDLSETNEKDELNENNNFEKTEQFKKHLAVTLVGGINFWNAFDKTNVNHDYVSGFPGYTINPSVSFFVKSNQAIQLDYEYTFLQELFDYDGTHAIRVPVDSAVVKQVVNSLTGQVISEDRQNVVVDGARYQREVKYNKYKLHALSLGFNYGRKLNSKSKMGIYLGTSILFKVKGKGRRLNEELDATAFDQSNSIFGKTQLGLRLGLEYSYAIGRNTSLIAQLMTTKYLTSWELDSSVAKTRPFLYGLQLGIRQRFRK